MLNNLYVSSTLLWEFSIEEAIKILHNHGVPGMEVWAEQAWYHQSSEDAILSEAVKCGIKLMCHAASWDVNICALNAGVRSQSVREILNSVVFAERIGARNLTVHPGKITLSYDWTSWHFDVLLDSLTRIADFAKAHGVTISVELMEPVQKEFITDPDAMNSLLSKLPDNVMSTLDIAHLPAEDDFLPYLTQTMRVNKVHISNRKGDKYHVQLGQGDLDCRYMVKELIKTGLPMVVEGYDCSPGQTVMTQNINFIRQLLDENIIYKGA